MHKAFLNGSDNTLNSVIEFADSVRLEPLWRSVRQATTDGSFESAGQAGYDSFIDVLVAERKSQ